jgi:hypothetical protein
LRHCREIYRSTAIWPGSVLAQLAPKLAPWIALLTPPLEAVTLQQQVAQLGHPVATSL